MRVYLDSVFVVYLIEGFPIFQAAARARWDRLKVDGDQAVITDLTLLECCVKPLRDGSPARVAAFEAFHFGPDVLRFPLTAAIFAEAARIRASFRYGLADSLHLAAAVEAGCGLFLTNDRRLSHFPGLAVEVIS